MADLEIKDINQVHAGAHQLATLSGAFHKQCSPPEPHFGNDDFGVLMRSNYPAEWVAEINQARTSLGRAVEGTGTNISRAADLVAAQDAEDAEGFSRIGDGGGGGGGQSAGGSSVVPAAPPAGPPPPAGPGPAPAEADQDLELRTAYQNANAVDRDAEADQDTPAQEHINAVIRAADPDAFAPGVAKGSYVPPAAPSSEAPYGASIGPAPPIAGAAPDSSAGAPGMGTIPPPPGVGEAHLVPAPEPANDSGYYISPLPPTYATLFPEASYGDSVAPVADSEPRLETASRSSTFDPGPNPESYQTGSFIAASSPEAAAPQYDSPPERQSAELTTMPGQGADQGSGCGPDGRESHSASMTGAAWSRTEQDGLDLHVNEHSPDRDSIKWKSRYRLL